MSLSYMQKNPRESTGKPLELKDKFDHVTRCKSIHKMNCGGREGEKTRCWRCLVTRRGGHARPQVTRRGGHVRPQAPRSGTESSESVRKPAKPARGPLRAARRVSRGHSVTAEGRTGRPPRGIRVNRTHRLSAASAASRADGCFSRQKLF